MKIDAHVHIFGTDIESADRLIETETKFAYNRFLFLSLEAMDLAAQNALAIYLKLKRPDCYIFGSLNYDGVTDFKEEVVRLREIGFDGMKFIEQKPTERRRLGRSLLDPTYDELFRYMEKEGMPALMHVGDPPEFWDAALAPPFAKENGWFYGEEGFVPLEQLYEEHERLFEKYPDMPIILAHFYFLSHRPDELTRLMKKFSRIYVDLTSGTEMYFNFSRNPDFWRTFFVRWNERIIYGTDNTDSENETDIYNSAEINRMQEAFLTEDKEFPVWDQTVRGIGLPEDIQENIMGGNILRICGEPRPLDKTLASDYLEDYIIRTPNLLQEHLSLITEIKALL